MRSEEVVHSVLCVLSSLFSSPRMERTSVYAVAQFRGALPQLLPVADRRDVLDEN